MGRSAAADALPVVKTAASFQESPGKATILPSPSTGGNMLGSRPTTATRTARLAAALVFVLAASVLPAAAASVRSEEHTSELQSLMRISYAVFCLKKKKYICKL